MLDKQTIQALLKKHYPDFLPVDLIMKPWLVDLINAAYQKGYEAGEEAVLEQAERVMH